MSELNAEKAREMVVMEEGKSTVLPTIQMHIEKRIDDYSFAKGYLAALEGPEVRELIHGLNALRNTMPGEYQDDIIKLTLSAFRKAVKP